MNPLTIGRNSFHFSSQTSAGTFWYLFSKNMSEKRSSSAAGFENPEVQKKSAFKVPLPELITCFICGKTMTTTKIDMKIHISNCTVDSDLEEVMEGPVSQETHRNDGTTSNQSQERHSRMDSGLSGTLSPSSTVARSTSLSSALSGRSVETTRTESRASSRAQSSPSAPGRRNLSGDQLAHSSPKPSDSGISSSNGDPVTPISSGLAKSTPNSSGRYGSKSNPVTPHSSGNKGSSRRKLQTDSPNTSGTPTSDKVSYL